MYVYSGADKSLEQTDNSYVKFKHMLPFIPLNFLDSLQQAHIIWSEQ